MKSFRNLSMAALTLLSVLFFSLYGCQKEATQANLQLVNQNLQVELRADHCGGEIRDVAEWFSKSANVWYPAPTPKSIQPTIPVGINGQIAFQRIGPKTNYTINFTRGVKVDASTDLKNAIGSAGTGRDAHHIIPWNMRDDELVQRAAKAGFHPNHPINGIGLLSYIDNPGKKFKFHTQVVTTYDPYVQAILTAYNGSSNYSTPDAAYKFLACGLIPHLKALLIDAEKEQLDVLKDWIDRGKKGTTPTNLNYQYCKWDFGSGKTSCDNTKDKLKILLKNWPL